MKFSNPSKATKVFPLSSTKRLVVHHRDSSGFSEMRIFDEDGDFMPITMNELLNAVSAAYYCQKDKHNR